jgi:hypothetical protein
MPKTALHARKPRMYDTLFSILLEEKQGKQGKGITFGKTERHSITAPANHCMYDKTHDVPTMREKGMRRTKTISIRVDEVLYARMAISPVRCQSLCDKASYKAWKGVFPGTPPMFRAGHCL